MVKYWVQIKFHINSSIFYGLSRNLTQYITNALLYQLSHGSIECFSILKYE